MEQARTQHADQCRHQRNTQALTATPATEVATKAIGHLLRRIQQEPRLAAFFAPDSESMNRITEAYAALMGMDLRAFRRDYLSRLRFDDTTVGGSSTVPRT